ncbi:MAG: LemA family protein [Parvibaculum sp.]|uniref:LemA family protein n=1 Tax=Parvibaculum sp. TaxID=2024848 RepID=UPI002842BD96|nr:LemA family protein [Parvibaculum sp.]MDR3498047.1 LemA family protein [Parvibaculum sp.]
MSNGRIVLLSILGVIALVAVWIFSNINTIPRQDEAANAAWSQVLNQYQRRADLVPNLVATVKGYAAHEEKVLTEVTNARAHVGQIATPDPNDPKAVANYEAAQRELGGALSRLLVVSENYPQLKANENFLTLQSQLEGAENRISVARRDYIQAVQTYNTTLRTFPGRLIASLFYSDMKPRANFTADVGAEKAPQVQF